MEDHEEVIETQVPQISKKQALKNWMQFEMSEEIAEALVANKFMQPTEVQSQSLVYLNAHVDMVIAAKTGQGKTLCFGIPILDLLCKRLIKEAESDDVEEYKSIKALIMSPTRELAIQIKDHIQAVVPVQYQEKIKLCPLVGGMSVQKQERLLSYNPTVIIATPGRLWELLNERMNPYLQSELPMIDVLVLDEADRMIEDGHFKEMKYILDYVYSKRVEFKKLRILKTKVSQQEVTPEEQEKRKKIKEEVLTKTQKRKNDFVVKQIESARGVKFDMSKVVDLYDESEMLDEINPEDLLIDDQDKEEKKEEDKTGNSKKKRLSQHQIALEQEEKFAKEYKKMGGIQHIICSATMTIDPSGRITPKKAKKLKKQGHNKQESINTLEQLCKTLRFRSKQPKVIDLTEEERMPATLKEYAIKCEQKEKDLYVYYFLRQKSAESCIIFSNSITCTKRISSLLSFLKIPNNCLHSKMQQRQRLKNLDRFKSQVQAIESGVSTNSAVLVCTDVAARGLDIPYVQNVVHYQCPFNAEIYIHRCGRTARIGREGESLALLAAEDEKNFKIIRKVLKKDTSTIEMFSVSYYQLSKLEPLVEAAKEFESVLHRTTKEEKSASWMLKMAKQADLQLDDEDEKTILGLDENGASKKKKKKEIKAPIDIFDTDLAKLERLQDGEGARHKTKQLSKVQQMKSRYDNLKSQEQFKKISNSSFLTPEAASYLNELIKKNQTNVDQELVFAGQHSENVGPKKFKRKEKFTSRYKNRTKKRRRN
ncbi:atp-dependent rna helicase ddx24 [Stylonychia lemnae]|uniref:Atp-dependent rna helicase ddx24 n=1 Tax=Stylonychia lemnae TaxID=5949 RepID=A0A078A466_STYLE|nr:atp-dependent rna helicase ddx24 [Stylonychia lemnae]|eukprot:CDW75544.1 atp-dependent rna helicase ddx24 [Stylonychia lemnae]